MMMIRKLTLALIALLFTSTAVSVAAQQPPTKFEIERARIMLDVIKSDVKKNYYDPNYHGLDIETRFKAADEKLKQAISISQLWGIIAQALADLNDSHTYFLPPSKRART